MREPLRDQLRLIHIVEACDRISRIFPWWWDSIVRLKIYRVFWISQESGDYWWSCLYAYSWFYIIPFRHKMEWNNSNATSFSAWILPYKPSNSQGDYRNRNTRITKANNFLSIRIQIKRPKSASLTRFHFRTCSGPRKEFSNWIYQSVIVFLIYTQIITSTLKALFQLFIILLGCFKYVFHFLATSIISLTEVYSVTRPAFMSSFARSKPLFLFSFVPTTSTPAMFFTSNLIARATEGLSIFKTSWVIPNQFWGIFRKFSELSVQIQIFIIKFCKSRKT